MTIFIDGPDQVLYQWDKGQRIMLHGVPDGVRVDFALCGSDKAVSVELYTESGVVFCDIPDALLMGSGQLHGYIYKDDADRGETIFSFVYQVIPRPKPDDYVEPEEVLLWRELDRRISELEQNDVSAEQIGAAVEKYLEENPVEVPEPDLTGYAKEQWVEDNYQPKGKYLTEVPEGYAKTEDIPTEPEDIGADPKGTAASAVSEHNVDTDSHNDIRLELKSLSDRLTAFFDSDDATLDELSEIVAYITSNKSLIDSITTSKINVADIVNNLTTNVATKPLSAAQGVVLKGLIDTLNANLSKYALASAIPTKVSQLQNDAGYLNEHQDISGKLDASELPTAINTALAQAKSSGEFDGAPGKDGADGQPGKDGTSPVVSVSAIKGGHRITITDKNGTKTVDVLDGSDGKDGKDGNPGTNGQDGNGIKSAVLNADYTLTLAFDDGTSYTTPSIRGATGATGAAGKNGANGANGKTPVKFVDYFTDADKEEFLGEIDAVRYVEQTLTPKQQAQARQNIGAAEQTTVDGILQKLSPMYGGSVNVFDDSDVTVGQFRNFNVGMNLTNIQAYGKGWMANQAWSCKKGDVIRVSVSWYTMVVVYDASNVVLGWKTYDGNPYTVAFDNAAKFIVQSADDDGERYKKMMVTVNNDMPGSYVAYSPVLSLEKMAEDIEDLKNPKFLKKPFVVLSFDAFNLSDNRFNIVKGEYGFNATVAHRTADSADINKTVMKAGWDIGLYKLDGHPSVTFGNDAAVSETPSAEVLAAWDAYVKSAVDEAEAAMVYNPVVWLTRTGTSCYGLETALKKYGIPMCRGAYNPTYANDWDYSPDELPTMSVACTTLMPSALADCQAAIAEAVANGHGVAFLTHGIYSTDADANTNYGVTEATLRSFLDTVKSYVDAGKLEMLTYRDIYSRYHPEEARERDYNRLVKMAIHG